MTSLSYVMQIDIISCITFCITLIMIVLKDTPEKRCKAVG